MDKKELFLQEVTRKWGEGSSMIDYCVKKSAYVVELEDGDILSIDKPTIETRFCFGYGYCGISTESDRKSASASAQNARTNADYFKEENLKGIDEWLNLLKDDSARLFKLVNYYGVPEDFKLKEIRHYNLWDSVPNNAKMLTPNERQAIIKGYEEVRAKFEKRLNTYLKRYGTSKIHSWTYLVD